VGGRTVSGTTDTILCDSGTSLRDRGTVIQYTSASAVAVTLPQAGSTGCSSNFVFSVFVTGAGAVTITPTTSTINGQTSLVLGQNSWVTIASLDNTNYVARSANYAKTGTGLNSTFNADGSTTFALATALPNGTTATSQPAGTADGTVASTQFVANALGIGDIDYDCNFGGGITAEGLIGNCGWYADLAGTGGSISRSSDAAPDINHFALLALKSGNASGNETGIGWGYCNVTTPTTACGAGTQANEIFPELGMIKFKSYFVFKNPSVLTSIRLCAVYQSLSFLTHTCDQSDGPDQTIGVQFSTSAGDTHWMAVTGDATGGGGAHNTRTDTGVTPVASDYTCVLIFSTSVGTIQFEVGDSATSPCLSLSSPVSISTTLPTSSESPWMLVAPLNTTQKTMYPIRWKFHADVAQ